MFDEWGKLSWSQNGSFLSEKQIIAITEDEEAEIKSILQEWKKDAYLDTDTLVQDLTVKLQTLEAVTIKFT